MTEHLTNEQLLAAIERASQKAADAGVDRVCLLLGVDPEDKNATKRFQDNMQYLELRRTNEDEFRKLVKNSAATLFTAALLGVGAMLFFVFKEGFRDAISSWLQK